MEAVPFSKEYVDNVLYIETIRGDQHVRDIDGNLWKVGNFDVPTQTYWCTRVEKNFVLLDGEAE